VANVPALDSLLPARREQRLAAGRMYQHALDLSVGASLPTMQFAAYKTDAGARSPTAGEGRMQGIPLRSALLANRISAEMTRSQGSASTVAGVSPGSGSLSNEACR
jgi:hypothetical protein